MSTEMAIGWQDDRPVSELRVCADPNNLPYSNERGEGFENALARLIAADLHRTLRYTWWPQRRGFIRETLQAGRCDVVMGMPTTSQSVRLTQPYYRSSFMFVTRRDDHLPPAALDDALDVIDVLIQGAAGKILTSYPQKTHPGRECIQFGHIRREVYERALSDVADARSILDRYRPEGSQHDG